MNKVALTLVLFAVYLLIVGAVTGLAWLCLIGMVVGVVGVVIFALTDAPLIETDDPSRLDLLDGVTEWDRDEADRARYIDDYLDLRSLTDEQLEAVIHDRITEARAHLGDQIMFDAAIGRHAEAVLEQTRRLDRYRKSTGWTWPKEVDAGPLGSGHSPRASDHDVADCGGSVEEPSTHLIRGSASTSEVTGGTR